MIEFRNRLTGTKMWVADERKDEYLAAGHVLAANTQKPIVTEEKVEAAPKKPAKRATKKK